MAGVRMSMTGLAAVSPSTYMHPLTLPLPHTHPSSPPLKVCAIPVWAQSSLSAGLASVLTEGCLPLGRDQPADLCLKQSMVAAQDGLCTHPTPPLFSPCLSLPELRPEIPIECWLLCADSQSCCLMYICVIAWGGTSSPQTTDPSQTTQGSAAVRRFHTRATQAGHTPPSERPTGLCRSQARAWLLCQDAGKVQSTLFSQISRTQYLREGTLMPTVMTAPSHRQAQP